MATGDSLQDRSSTQEETLRIGIVALNAYPVIEPGVGGGFGGIETRAWEFAQGLAQQPGVEVEFVVRHHRPLVNPVRNSVHLQLWLDRLYPLRESVLSRVSTIRSFPWLKIHKPTWSLLWELPVLACSKIWRGGNRDPRRPHKLFESLPVDVWLTFGVQGNSATVIASAQTQGKPAVLFLGSDGDLDERYARSDDFVSVYRDRADVCRWVLQQADHILVQTERQQQLLQQRFHRESTIIPNPIDVQTWNRRALSQEGDPHLQKLQRYALWIGRADGEHKRPQLCVELAKRCPDVPFLVVLNPRDDIVEQQVRSAAPHNLTIVPAIPFEQMPSVFRQAAVLVNTSSLEGFPNTYLQAALSGVPIASLVVESAFLQRTRSGWCADGDMSALAKYVRECHAGRSKTDVQHARQEVIAMHGLEPLAARLAATLRTVIRNESECTRKDAP